MRNGKTVEVDNTDAEGRLVLADALSYAARYPARRDRRFRDADGRGAVALGHECAGLMTPDDALARELIAAGEADGRAALAASSLGRLPGRTSSPSGPT